MTFNLQDVVKEFAECVVAQSNAIAKADANLGNRFAKRYIAAFKTLRLHGDEGREALAVLLSDSRANVRVMAAAYLLRYKHDQAKAVLEAEAEGAGIVAFGASQALQRWKDGSWALDPE